MKKIGMILFILTITQVALANETSFVVTDQKRIFGIEPSKQSEATYLVQFDDGYSCGNDRPQKCSDFIDTADETGFFSPPPNWAFTVIESGTKAQSFVNPDLQKSDVLGLTFCYPGDIEREDAGLWAAVTKSAPITSVQLEILQCSFDVETFKDHNTVSTKETSKLVSKKVVPTPALMKKGNEEFIKRVYEQYKCDVVISKKQCQKFG